MLKDVLADVSANLSLAFNLPQSGVKTPGSNYVALALVARNALPDLGSQYTPAGGGAAVTLTTANLVAMIKQLCFLDQAVFFGNGTLNGKKGMPDEFMESAKYGTRTQERPTGDVKESLEIGFKHFFLNVKFFNALRSGLKAWDVYLFTESSVQYIRHDSDEVVFHKIGHNIDGDITKEISGSFTIAWTREGELEPMLGISVADLEAETMRYSFADYGVLTGLTAVAGQADRFTLAAATAGNFTRPVVEGGTVSYAIFRDNKTAISTELVTIDTLSGKVSFAQGMPTGRYTFTVVAYNTTGVFGTYKFTIDKLAA